MGIFWVLVFASIRTSLSLENSWYPLGVKLTNLKRQGISKLTNQNVKNNVFTVKKTLLTLLTNEKSGC